MDNQDSPVRAISELDFDMIGGVTSSMIDYLDMDDLLNLDDFGMDFALDEDGQLVANNNNNSNNNNADDLHVDDPLNRDRFSMDFQFNDNGQPVVSDMLLSGDEALADQRVDYGKSEGDGENVINVQIAQIAP